jgi:hypothetical protein
VKIIDEGIEILTGIPAGIRQADGLFPPGTVNHMVDAKLSSFAERWKHYRLGQ